METTIQSYRDLRIYQAAFALQQEIFKATHSFPAEERYSLTDQLRRSSRSMGANLAEAWAKRRFPAHFLSKLTDVDGEASETWHWLETANACGYLDEVRKAQLITQLEDVCRMLGRMMHKADTFVPLGARKTGTP
ncbi:MAG: four helix bundle protein [Opitutaceae bacterium]|jgi:four helix bundle protein